MINEWQPNHMHPVESSIFLDWHTDPEQYRDISSMGLNQKQMGTKMLSINLDLILSINVSEGHLSKRKAL